MQSAVPELFASTPPDVLRLFKGTEPKGDRVTKLLRFGKKDVADAVRVPLSSVRYDDKMSQELRRRLVEWATVLNLVHTFFKEQSRTLLWFETRNHLLGGMAPRDMIRLGRFDKLRKVIDTALADNRP